MIETKIDKIEEVTIPGKRAKKRYDRFNNRTISINGDIQIDVFEEEFLDKFTTWLQKNNWKFTGITKEIE